MASNWNIGGSQQGPGMDIGASQRSAAVETITVDKWNGSYPNQIARKILAVALIPAFFFVNIEPLPAAETITVDKWFVQASEPIREIQKAPDFPSHFAPPEQSVNDGIANLGWRSSIYDNPVLPQDNRWTYPSFWPDQISTNALEEEKQDLGWRSNFYENPVLARESRWTYPSFFGEDLFEIPGVEDITVDKWFVRTSEPLFDKPPKPLEGYAEPPRGSVDQGIQNLGWRPNFYDNPVLPKDNRWVYPTHFEPPAREALEPEASQLGWRPNFYENPVLGKDIRWTYPSLFGDADLFEVPGVEAITVDKWFVQASEPLHAKPPKPLEGYAEPPSRVAIEAETAALGWRPNFYDNPVLGRDVRWTYPYFMADSQLDQVPIGPTTFTPKTFSINLNIDQGRDLNLNIDKGRDINFNRC